MGIKIGLDIDGVVANSFPVFLQELNKHYGKNVAKIDSYDMTDLYGATWQEIDKFFAENMEYLFLEPEPMEGAIANIKSLLQAGHEISFITARKPGAEEEVTLRWFQKYNIPATRTNFVGGRSKVPAVRKFGLDVFVEDFMSNALEIAEIGVPVLLLDAPYNEGETPSGVTRCYNWEDIRYHIDRLILKQGDTK